MFRKPINRPKQQYMSIDVKNKLEKIVLSKCDSKMLICNKKMKLKMKIRPIHYERIDRWKHTFYKT